MKCVPIEWLAVPLAYPSHGCKGDEEKLGELVLLLVKLKVHDMGRWHSRGGGETWVRIIASPTRANRSPYMFLDAIGPWEGGQDPR